MDLNRLDQNILEVEMRDGLRALRVAKELYPSPRDPQRLLRDRLLREGAEPREVALELARDRQRPLFEEDPAHPLKHGDPPGGESWDLIHERILSNIKQAMKGRRIDGRRLTASALAKKLPNTTTGKNGITPQRARYLLHTHPEELSRVQVLALCAPESLGCTLDYLRGLVDDPHQYYRTASEAELLNTYRYLSPEGQHTAWRVIRALSLEEHGPVPADPAENIYF